VDNDLHRRQLVDAEVSGRDVAGGWVQLLIRRANAGRWSQLSDGLLAFSVLVPASLSVAGPIARWNPTKTMRYSDLLRVSDAE